MAFREQPQRPCPGCGSMVADETTRCACGYGLRAEIEAEAARTPHRTLFGSDESPEGARLAREFRCPHCRSFGARVETLSMWNSGELQRFGTSAVATCRFCGAQQLFDLETFNASRGVRWDILEG